MNGIDPMITPFHSLRQTRPCVPAGRRPASAVVELAVVVPLMFTILIGIWEIGRLIQIQQMMHCATRDAARLAAQAYIINTNGESTQIRYATGSPNLDATIRSYLYVAGIKNQTGLTTSFAFVNADGSLDTGREPWQGRKNDRFRITIALPYDNVRWTNLGLVNPKTVTTSLDWQMLVDDPFTLDTTLPGWSP